MKTKISVLCLYLMCVLFFAWGMPTAYIMLFEKEIAKTHIFYSPTDKKIIYTEQIRNRDLKAEEKSEGHHADIIYKDEDDNYYTRLEFEERLPFIYFRNMEMRGLLPMTIGNKSFNSADIQKDRRVLELAARRLDGKNHMDPVYPMLESNPDQVALVLPADRFRMTSSALEWIDSDLNAVDVERTALYTEALVKEGFSFPCQGVWGNFTTFKPYDAGIFMTDAKGKTYHILRYNDMPVVKQVPFPSNVVPQRILLSETKDKMLFGLVLDKNNAVHLFHTKDYGLTTLPTPNYNPDMMDVKVLMDPLYITVTYSDPRDIHVVVYDAFDMEQSMANVQEVHRYVHNMSKNEVTMASTIQHTLFPFSISLEGEDSSIGVMKACLSPHYLTYCLPFNILLAMMYLVLCRRKKAKNTALQSISVCIFGIYILIPMLLLEQYKDR